MKIEHETEGFVYILGLNLKKTRAGICLYII